MRPPATTHYLRPNHAEWTPRCVITLDSESRVVPGSDPEVLALRLWAATIEDRRPPKSGQQSVRHDWGHTTDELIETIEGWLKGRESAWIYAHNLSFDLVTTRFPLALVDHGWEITEAAVSGRAPWLRARKGKVSITMADSWSWLPMALETVGAALKIPKLPLPKPTDGDAEWLARCRRDVEILHTAIADLMNFWDRNNLGHWSLSGAGCGWNAYRHIKSFYKVTIEPSATGQVEDRTYIHGGRRGTWRVGHFMHGPYAEIDFTAAYPTIARDCALPTKRSYAFESLPIDSTALHSEHFDVAAKVRIRTDTPRWPVRIDGHNWHPTGHFWADLAGPEIREAIRLGCLEEVGTGRAHRMGYAMSEWATWVLKLQSGELDDSPPVARLAAKNWGRAVIGKFAARSYERTLLGPSPEPGWSYEQGWDQASGTKGGMVDIGGKRWWQSASAISENAYPAVTAWVESEVRVRLGRVIEAVGPDCVLQCDTDGMIVDMRIIGSLAAHGHLVAPSNLRGMARLQWVLNQLDPVIAPLTMRVKRRAPHVTIIGPQHTLFGGQRRFSGIPSDAIENEDKSLTIQTWPNLQWQMKHGSSAGYVRPTVKRTVRGPYATGWVTIEGRVIPPEAYIAADGTTRLLPWERTENRPPGAMLGADQHPGLANLW